MSGIIGGAGSKSGVIGETELDYEEGTWTAAHPTWNMSTTYSSYVKVGGLVSLRAKLTFNADPSSGINAQFTGVPFAASADGVWIGPVMCKGLQVKNYDDYVCFIQGSLLFIYGSAVTGNWGSLDYNEIDDGTEFYVSVTYKLA